MRSPVDHEYPVPLYWQVAEAIRRQIADGVLNPGDKLPTEKWLTENYKVSRVTARKAVQTLIDNGTLERVAVQYGAGNLPGGGNAGEHFKK